MELTVLGSGTSVPHSKRSSSAYWLETRRGSLLLDCSPSALLRMAQERLPWPELDAIWISHFHLDHFGGLAPFLFGTKWAPETLNRKKPLTIWGPEGLEEIIRRVDETYGYGLLEQPFPIELCEVDPLESFEALSGISAVSFDTPHTEDSRAIRITDEESGSMVFTSDTGFSKALGDFARKTDVFLMECSFVKEKPVENHLELSEAVYLARYSKAKKTILTHLYPEWDEVDFRRTVDDMRPGCEILEARDGMRIVIGG